ncbi:hypothetical protein ACJIZ3_003138 [Penstemon smallii]|uniref:NAC domain-containing protein n=1 Tax=Penstemon smallii TaxID=265156 RepID=A0ABD3U8S5_9LAMI
MGSSSSGGGVPPGFRFHPTDEELLHFYLKKKLTFQKFDMEVIREVDLNKIEPWDLQEKCKIGSTPQNEWYFFSHKDRKYPTGSRTNRATSAGFWKATGRDKCIRNSFKKIGMRKTLVFYRGRAPHGQKTDWIMHEYRLEDADTDPQATHEDGWVVCRVFKKKNLFKVGGNSSTSSHEGGSGVHHNSGGMMMMMMNGGDQLNMGSSTNQLYTRSHPFPHRDSTINQYLLQNPDHHQSDIGLNYISHIPHQYHQQLEAQNFISAHNPMKPLMEECDHSSDQGAIAARSDDQNHLNEWDRLVITNTNSHDPEGSSKGLGFLEENTNTGTSSINQVNQLSLRSEMDFWAYGK